MGKLANSIDPDKTQQDEVPQQGLHWLLSIFINRKTYKFGNYNISPLKLYNKSITLIHDMEAYRRFYSCKSGECIKVVFCYHEDSALMKTLIYGFFVMYIYVKQC